MSHAPTGPRRRRPTRWLLITPITALVLMVGGVVALEAIHPQVDPSDRVVPGVPALAIDEERSCTRPIDQASAEDLRAEFVPGGRVSSTQVYLCPLAYDGLSVTYVGEVIGEVLPRRGGAWAQVNDDVYALEVGPVIGHRELAGFNTGMSVWLPDGLHERVEDVGRAGRRGDVILVRGTLLRADPDDGGGITVRAESMEILAEGLEVEVPFHLVQAIVAGILALLAIVALLWSRQVRQR